MSDRNEKNEAPGMEKIKKYREITEFASSCMNLLLKVSAMLGGAILLLYAVKERFFYDVSSIAALAVLTFVFCAFAGIILIVVSYGMATSIWFIALTLWISNKRKKGEYSISLKPPLSGKVAAWGSFFMFLSIGLGFYVAFASNAGFPLVGIVFSWTIGFFTVTLFFLRSEQMNGIRDDNKKHISGVRPCGWFSRSLRGSCR